ncbi:MAG: SoxR reducing system RseC family protein [Bacteroidales bacterium]|nr:SoxR reducing system RseC family protein [Bacteroidales bacterium]
MEDDLVKHQGIISEISRENIKVSIIAQSACASCHAKGFCSAADMQEKIIDVKNPGNFDQKAGDFVTITMKKKLGNKAVLYGYFLPFILLMATLIGSLSYFEDEGLAGLASLAVLIPYYFALYLLKDKLKESFEFQIEKNTFTTNFNTAKL